eukprot:TRINITY_DN20642_c0_g1_i1.p1 TRINITY_DN20642_c0_g1~~TRINITY_DN20642_c0_g1_i1.p1  ORF type:complete len:507 (+),score=59.68 TRINITY_DN20642_c0_g1_i1:108-1523(+)
MKNAMDKGLATGTWWVPQIPREDLRRLMQRDDWHATRDMIVLFSSIFGFGYAAYYFYAQSSYLLSFVCFWCYCTLYCSSGDSRWHECGHSTAFRTKWLNDVFYYIASFMVLREPRVWRFSHAKHHTHTDIVGLDPEIDGRPLSMWSLFILFFNYQLIRGEMSKIWLHAQGKLSDPEKTFVPWNERFRVFLEARIFLGIFAFAILLSLVLRSPWPSMYVFLPYTLGAWHFILVGVVQHAGLQHDVLDHRLNTRTIYINPVSAFIYWNMHYHVEHHTFPMVPYYNLPELHQILKPQLPKPYNSLWESYAELIPALIKQSADPSHYIERTLPPPLPVAEANHAVLATPDKDGWVAACTTDEVPAGEILRFDVGPKTYCVYHAADDDTFYATAGKCTHGAAELSDGLITDNLIECPKHNGCFDFKTGEAKRLPAKIRLATYPVKVEGQTVFVNVGDKDSRKHIQIAYEEEKDKKA